MQATMSQQTLGIINPHPAIDASTPTCLSGGASGADNEWGNVATALQHSIIHWSFPTHDALAATVSSSQVIRLSDDELDLPEITSTIEAAATAQSTCPPPDPHTARLIRRIYYQVAWAQSLYAITSLGVDAVTGKPLAGGGTMWAITMFGLLHPESEKCLVYDQEKGVVWKARGSKQEDWASMNGVQPPRPEGVWAGVGARILKESGREAIRWVMRRRGEAEEP